VLAMSTSERSSRVVQVLRGGRIVIPAEFRRLIGIEDDSLLRITVEDGDLRVSPVNSEMQGKERDWLDALYDAYAPTRADILARGISEEEVNTDIDAAIAEVRAEQRAQPE
jgi:bifunctional DNA-binding transcriptional regulator/antitoxin component of YhaV-PrlF toxin-antitoxin module